MRVREQLEAPGWSTNRPFPLLLANIFLLQLTSAEKQAYKLLTLTKWHESQVSVCNNNAAVHTML